MNPELLTHWRSRETNFSKLQGSYIINFNCLSIQNNSQLNYHTAQHWRTSVSFDRSFSDINTCECSHTFPLWCYGSSERGQMYGATFQRVAGAWRRMDRCCGWVGESLAKERIVWANLWAPSQLFSSGHQSHPLSSSFLNNITHYLLKAFILCCLLRGKTTQFHCQMFAFFTYHLNKSMFRSN